MINGQAYDWESMEARLPHGTLLNFDSIEYSDELPGTPVYGKGRAPRAYGRGRYAAKGKLSMQREEYDRLAAHIDAVNLLRVAQGKHRIGVLTLPPFPIVVGYGNDDKPSVTDTLPECQFTTHSTGMKEGDEASRIEMEFVCYAPILWNGRSAC